MSEKRIAQLNDYFKVPDVGGFRARARDVEVC